MNHAAGRFQASGGTPAEAPAAGNESDDFNIRFSTDPRDYKWVADNVPCQEACPAKTNIPAYIRMIAEQRYDDSYEVNELANVLPGVLGRICSRPCEDACRHAWPGNGEPVDICHLKRAAADLRAPGADPTPQPFPATGKRVAVVGAGPAGIAAAHDLAIFGHEVTVIEREEKPGGMLFYGIPEFRLPRDELAAEIGRALGPGVTLQCGTAIGTGDGETPLAALLADYDAVLIATGTMRAMRLPLPDHETEGESEDIIRVLPDNEYGLDFLVELHRGADKIVGKRVAVIGGGFTAMDCARIARRMGATDVVNHIRTTEEFIPVTREEIAQAKEEGVKIRGMRSPVGIVTDDSGRMTGLRFKRNRLGEWRAGGRRQAIPIEGSEFVEDCDTVLVCIGQETEHDFRPDVEIGLDRWSNAEIDDNGMTSREGLFACGDYVLGATTVIDAIGHARRIATGLDKWLMGKERRRPVVRIKPHDRSDRERAFDFIPRVEMPMLSMDSRLEELAPEAELGFEAAEAAEEAKRCYLCYLNYEINVDDCIYCRMCIDVAPKHCIKLIEGVEVTDAGGYGELIETEDWSKVRAIWIDNAECIRCGACADVCPTNCISISRKELIWETDSEGFA